MPLGPGAGAATPSGSRHPSLAFWPAGGRGSAATTLVGQSIGAGDPAWAARVGNATIALSVAYMGFIGVAIALAGPWLVPLFVRAGDGAAAPTIALATS
ncbi:MAG: MATE family efflux transporter, partial [bacterium]